MSTGKTSSTVRNKILKALAIGAFIAMPLAGMLSASEARPPSHAPAHGYRNGNNGNRADRREDRRERRPDRRERRDTGRDRREDRRDRRDERFDGRFDIPDDRWDTRDRDDDRRDRNRSGNDGWWNRNRDRTGSGSSRSMTGTVTNVEGNERVDVNINGRIYNVFLASGVPQNVERGDIVRVSGVFRGQNNIENGRITVLENR